METGALWRSGSQWRCDLLLTTHRAARWAIQRREGARTDHETLRRPLVQASQAVDTPGLQDGVRGGSKDITALSSGTSTLRRIRRHHSAEPVLLPVPMRHRPIQAEEAQQRIHV